MRLTITLLMTIMICACGQKGPLFMPDQATPGTATQTTNEQSSKKGDVQLRAASDSPNKEQFEAQFNPQTTSPNP